MFNQLNFGPENILQYFSLLLYYLKKSVETGKPSPDQPVNNELNKLHQLVYGNTEPLPIRARYPRGIQTVEVNFYDSQDLGKLYSAVGPHLTGVLLPNVGFYKVFPTGNMIVAQSTNSEIIELYELNGTSVKTLNTTLAFLNSAIWLEAEPLRPWGPSWAMLGIYTGTVEGKHPPHIIDIPKNNIPLIAQRIQTLAQNKGSNNQDCIVVGQNVSMGCGQEYDGNGKRTTRGGQTFRIVHLQLFDMQEAQRLIPENIFNRRAKIKPYDFGLTRIIANCVANNIKNDMGNTVDVVADNIGVIITFKCDSFSDFYGVENNVLKGVSYEIHDVLSQVHLVTHGRSINDFVGTISHKSSQQSKEDYSALVKHHKPITSIQSGTLQDKQGNVWNIGDPLVCLIEQDLYRFGGGWSYSFFLKEDVGYMVVMFNPNKKTNFGPVESLGYTPIYT